MNSPQSKSGEIMLGEHVFRWVLQGERPPEICGWLKHNHDIVKGSYGFWRTADPEEAARRASAALL